MRRTLAALLRRVANRIDPPRIWLSSPMSTTTTTTATTPTIVTWTGNLPG